MTSLGLLQYSEINDSSAINLDIDKKKQTKHNTTIKKRPDNNENVQNMLKLINNSNGYENEDDNGLADFNPPPKAEITTKAGSDPQPLSKNLTIDYEKPTHVQNKIDESMTTVSETNVVKPRQYPAPLDSYEGFNTLPKTYASDYYKQYVPYFNQTSSQQAPMNKGQILEKLNYMIHLLEEQKDEKTGHVMEEIILYSFLGVFIIFIVDSFARVGKYTR